MDDSQIIKTANTILSQLTVPRRVKTIKDVNADMFITLYEGLCGETIPDLVRPAKSEEDDVHNTQCVIDSLALDILHTSLAHIIGEDVVSGRRMSIVNLLDIFSGLLEYILDGIEKEDNSTADADATRDTDAIGQSVLSDAIRQAMKDTTNRQSETSDDNTEALIALGETHSPTASPSSKKSRRSGERNERRRLSKKATPQVLSQPIANSSMQSINTASSCTESESDASAKPSAGRALSFSKVPAESCSKDAAPRAEANVTFTKPSVPPEKSIAQKLADEILKTGESTRELILLGDTPVLRTRTRSSTKQDKPNEDLGGVLNKSNNARQSKAAKRSRQPKRHVSFVSDRTLNNDDTSQDINSYLPYEPSRVQSEHYREGRQLPHTSDEGQLNLSSRLVDYFDQKEAGGGDDLKPRKSSLSAKVECGELSPLTQSSEYQTAMEKSASLYDRVTTLRNAANDKLESLRSESRSEQFVSAGGDLSTTEYYLPAATSHRLSNYARNRTDPKRLTSDPTIDLGADGEQRTGKEDVNLTTTKSAPLLTSTHNLATCASSDTNYQSVQSNVPDLCPVDNKPSRSSATEERSPYSYTTARLPPSSFEDLTTAKSTIYPTRVDNSESYATARLFPFSATEDSSTTRSQYVRSRVTGDERSRFSERLYNPAATATRSSELDTEYTRDVDDSLGIHNRMTHLSHANLEDGTSKLTTNLRPHLAKAQPEFQETKKPGVRTRSSVTESVEKKVRFNRSSASAAPSKSKSQTVLDAVKKTLDEEKWRDRIQQKLLARQYKNDLTDMVEAHRDQLEEEKSLARIQDKEFASNVQRLAEAYGDKPIKSKPPCNPKGFLLPKYRVIKKKKSERQSRETASSSDQPSKPLDPGDDDFLPKLMEEFPHLYLPPETIQKMWSNHQQQTAAVSKRLEEDKRKKNKAKATIEDAEKRQALLMNIMQKELDHTKRMKQMRDKENSEIEGRRNQRDVRVQSARVKKYYDDYSTRMKSSMMKNKTKEEQLFKRLFAEGLKVQKERMQTLRAYAREQREKRSHRQQVDVASLENFYKDQFGMLAENVSQERRNVEVRDAAQSKVLGKMKMELRKKMEKDINEFQEKLKRDEDDYYFRQLDAEKVVQQLNMTRYQTGI